MNRNPFRRLLLILWSLIITSIVITAVLINLTYNTGHTIDTTFRVVTTTQTPWLQWHTTVTTTQGDTLTFQGTPTFLQGHVYRVIAISKPVAFGLGARWFIEEWWILSVPFAPVDLV